MTRLILLFLRFLAVFIFLFIFSIPSLAQSSQLVISEIMADPKNVKDAVGEWFEVYNSTDSEINLKDAAVKDNGRDSFKIIGDVIVGSKQYIVFCKDQDSSVNGGVNCQYQYDSFALANEEDEIIIEKDGQVLGKIIYNSSFPIKAGVSMELASLSNTGESPDHWYEASVQFGSGDNGTPGRENSGAPVPTPTKTPVPKSTDKPTKTSEPTKIEKATTVPTAPKPTTSFQAQVLGETEEDMEEESYEPTPTSFESAPSPTTTAIEPVLESTVESTPSASPKQFFLWGSMISFFGAIGSFWWVRKKGNL